VRKTKPEPKLCPLCGDKVGLSAESVRVHIRLKHPEAYAGSEVSSPSGMSLCGSGLSSPTVAQRHQQPPNRFLRVESLAGRAAELGHALQLVQEQQQQSP
jgi:hypothetical protein